MLLAFFALVKPASTIAKPACMKNTRKAVTSTQTLSIAVATFSGVIWSAAFAVQIPPVITKMRIIKLKNTFFTLFIFKNLLIIELSFKKTYKSLSTPTCTPLFKFELI